jgi:hypothetical protein
MKSFPPAKRGQTCISAPKKAVGVSGYGAAYLPFWHSSSLVYVSHYVGAYRYSWVARIDGLIKGRERLKRCQISIEPFLPKLLLFCLSFLLKIAGQEHPDRHRPTAGIKQWMAPAVDTQLNQLFHTQFHHFSLFRGKVPYFTATPAVRRVQPKKCAGMLLPASE